MTLTVDTEWPTTIPLPFVEFSGRPRNTTITSDPQNGRIWRRARHLTNYGRLDVKWVLDDFQLAAFQAFFETTLGNGAACFDLELRYPKNSALTHWLVRFVGGYEVSKTSGPSSVEAQLDLVRILEVPDAAS